MSGLTRRLATAAILLAPVAATAQDSDCTVVAAPAGLGPGTATTAFGDDITLTVAALYTPEAADSAMVRGQPIETWIADAFAAWQLVLDSAHAPGPRIVVEPRGVLEIDVPETGACFADLEVFRAHPRSAELRDSLEANLVVLFTARCSSAYQCTAASDCETFAYASARFSVAGLPNTEGGHALAHEAGHLLGMRHDIGADPTPGYHHGYRDEPGEFFTVMAFRGPLPRTDLVSAYSDPLRTFEGRPLGNVTEADNARVLRENAPIAAAWNQGTPVEPGPGSTEVTLRAVPNPARSTWLVEIATRSPGVVQMDLHDGGGRRIWTTDLDVSGARSIEVPAAGLAPGLYILRATAAGTASASSASIRLTIAR